MFFFYYPVLFNDLSLNLVELGQISLLKSLRNLHFLIYWSNSDVKFPR